MTTWNDKKTLIMKKYQIYEKKKLHQIGLVEFIK